MELAALKVEVATLTCETAAVEFKSASDPKDSRFWVQIMRSVLAMHNSGSGVIVFGLDSAGNRAAGDLIALRRVDPIQISDKARHYTDRPLPGIQREEFERSGDTYPGWVIPATLIPVPFSQSGDVHTGSGKPEKLFYRGQIYVRRGASSVPADAGDMAVIAERIRTAARDEFAKQMSGLVGLPAGYEVKGVPAGTILSIPTPMINVHLIDDPTVPGCVAFDMFEKYPYRQKELIAQLATRIPGCRVNQFDIQCMRRVYSAEFEEKKLLYAPRRLSAHYSDEMVEWIAGRLAEDAAFLEKTRAASKRSVAA